MGCLSVLGAFVVDVASFLAGFAAGVAIGEARGMLPEQARALGVWCGAAAAVFVFILFWLFASRRRKS